MKLPFMLFRDVLGIQLRKCSTAGSSKIKIIIIAEEGNIFNALIFLNDIPIDNELFLAAHRPVKEFSLAVGRSSKKVTKKVFCGMQSIGECQTG